MMNVLKSQTEFKIRLKSKSPLLISSIVSTAINIGGIDTFMAKNPITGKPFIPPTSLYGKLRYLYEITKSTSDKPSSYYFGVDGNAKPFTPAIINIKSVELIEDSAPVEFFRDKHENTINRYTLEASPRQYEVATEGLIYECAFSINLYNSHTETPDEIINKVLLPLLNTLQDEYIGGSGTRGFGEVEIEVFTGERFISINDIKKIEDISATVIQDKTINLSKSIRQEVIYLKTSLFSDCKIDSVTFAGLFAYALATMGNTALIKDIYDGNILKVTSTMPFVNSQIGRIHFFPKPQLYIKGLKNHNNKKKWLYEFDYVSESIFKEMIKSKFDQSYLLSVVDALDEGYKIQDRLLMTLSEFNKINQSKLFQEVNLVHLSIDAETGFYRIEKTDTGVEKGILFSTNDYLFSKDYGFYIIVEHCFEDLKPILDIISMLGIARDKTYGYGNFKFEITNADVFKELLSPTSSSRFLSLSLIHPSADDRERLKSGNSNYAVLTRKGKRENNSYTGTDDFRAEKDKIYMLKEGSVFDFEIRGSAPVVYPTNEEGYEIRDFGYSYLIGF